MITTRRFSTAFILIGLIISLLLPFFALPPFQIGLWLLVESVSVVLMLSAALVGAGLVLLPTPLLRAGFRHPTIYMLLGLALVPMIGAPFRDSPWLNWFGTPALGEGSASWVALAVLTVGVRVLSQDVLLSPHRSILKLTGIMVAGGLTLLAAFVPFGLAWVPYPFPDYLVFVVLIPLIAALLWRPVGSKPLGGVAIWAALVLSIGGIIVSQNLTVQVLLMGVVAFIAIAWMLCRKYLGVLTAAASTAVMLGFVVATAVISGSDESWFRDRPIAYGDWDYTLWDRGQMVWLALEALSAEQLTILFGHGWGSLQQLVAAHLPIKGVELATSATLAPNWSAASWLHFHTHSFAVEGLLSGGLTGLCLALLLPISLFPWKAIPSRPPLSDLVATWGVMVTAVVGTAWFQLPATLGFTALAFGAITGGAITGGAITGADSLSRGNSVHAFDDPHGRCAVRTEWGTPLRLALFIIVPALLWTASANHELAHQYPYSQIELDEEEPLCSLSDEEMQRGGGHLVRRALFQLAPLRKPLQEHDQIEASSLRTVANSLCMLHEATFRQVVPDLVAVASITLRGDLILSAQDHPHRAEILSSLGQTVERWGDSLERVLFQVPHRGDIAIGYFTWLLVEERIEELLRFTETRLRIAPADPVALWFRGTALLSGPDADQPRAINPLKRALDADIGRFVPIDAETRRLIIEQSQRQSPN